MYSTHIHNHTYTVKGSLGEKLPRYRDSRNAKKEKSRVEKGRVEKRRKTCAKTKIKRKCCSKINLCHRPENTERG